MNQKLKNFYAQPRGIRNNNPGNIRKGAKWQGLVMSHEEMDTAFAEFRDPTWGVRALATTLITYQDRYNLDTVKDIIARWAPPVENNTDRYVSEVCRMTGFIEDEPLDMHRYEALCPLVEAIIRHECGKGPLATKNTWYDRDVIDTGLQRAGVVNSTALVARVPMTKETVAATGTASLGAAQLADVAPQVMTALDSQQEQLSSGSIVRIVLGVMTIALAAYIAYSQIKKHQSGVVA